MEKISVEEIKNRLEVIKVGVNLVRIASVNLRGCKNNMFYLNELINSYDIILLQETWIEPDVEISEYYFHNFKLEKFEIKASRLEDQKEG